MSRFKRTFTFAAAAILCVQITTALGQDKATEARKAIDAVRGMDRGSPGFEPALDRLYDVARQLDRNDVDEAMIDDLQSLLDVDRPGADSALIALARIGAAARKTVPAMQVLLTKVDCDMGGTLGDLTRDALRVLGFPAAPRRCPPMPGLRWRLPSIVPEVVADAAPAPAVEPKGENAIASDEALAAECWKLVKNFPFGKDNWSFRAPTFSNSEKWGNVMRSSFVFAYVTPPPTGRMACWRQDGGAIAIVEYDDAAKGDLIQNMIITGPKYPGAR